jgi:hypothetical protein
MKHHTEAVSSGPARFWARPRGHRTAIVVSLVALAATLSAILGVAPAPADEPSGPPQIASFEVTEIHATRAFIQSSIHLANHETKWRVEYATSLNGPWTIGASGTFTLAYENGDTAPEPEIQHLIPDTNYYFREVAENAVGAAESETLELRTTAVSTPEIFQQYCPNGAGEEAIGEESISGIRVNNYICRAATTTTSINVESQIETNGVETEYRFEYATEKGGPWVLVPSASGSVTVAEDFAQPRAHLSGLEPETAYYIRVVATSAEGKVTKEVHTGTSSVKPEAFSSGSFSSVSGTSVRLEGSIYPGTDETRWRFEYATSEGGAFKPVPGASGTISGAQANEEQQPVEGYLTGLDPSTVYYVRVFAENMNGSSISQPVGFQTAGAPTATTFAVHSLHGEAERALGLIGPEGLDTHYHFQYVAEEEFDENGWAGALSTPEVDAGYGSVQHEGNVQGFTSTIIGEDLAGLQPGKTYHYRLVATNTAPGNPVVVGNEQTLTVVPAAASEEPSACPNEQLRGGLSASLPDCRAYEQVTPVEKEGAQEIFSYGPSTSGALVSQTGEDLMLFAPRVNFGSSPDSGQSPYFFSHTSAGWQMTAAGAQPQTGVETLTSQVYEPLNLSQLGFEEQFFTSTEVRSPNVEFKVGPPGGPYTTIASVPYKQAGEVGEKGLVANSADFSKLILEVEDHALLGHPTGTANGDDLYEWSGGKLSQVNVGIGSCGARIVKGYESPELARNSSAHAVSADGSRVFFEATPGSNCGGPSNLFMRVNGATTVDIGKYIFIAANAEGSSVLIETHSSTTHEMLLYDVESSSAKPLFTTHQQITGSAAFAVAKDLGALYFSSTERLTSEAPPAANEAHTFDLENIYRYDIASARLDFVAQTEAYGRGGLSPDGRYDYFTSSWVAGVPGGSEDRDERGQVYRYDSVERVVQCMSCASSFDPEPKLGASFAESTSDGPLITENGLPGHAIASANGNFVFFVTAAALVPQDLDGEIAAHPGDPEYPSFDNSPSGDVYEWRKDGVDGCAHAQGCLALISSGTGGLLNLLVGTDESGRDVFIYTNSPLVPQDNDTAGDIYDVRIDGGERPPAARPVECEGDACSTPPSPPNDATPSSLTFSGAGNLIASQAGRPAVRAKKPKAKKKDNKKKRKKGKKRSGTALKGRSQAKRSSRRSK